MRRRERLTLVLTFDVNRTNATVSGVDADDPAVHDPRAARAGRFQHHHSELLGKDRTGIERQKPYASPRSASARNFSQTSSSSATASSVKSTSRAACA
jgi:hypothetical protein